MPRLSVVTISDAFSKFWSDLAADLNLTIDMVGPDDAATATAGAVAVVLAAGGAERDAVRWLETHGVPRLPLLVVGTDPGRRTSMQLIKHGATDYFALPEDLETFRSALAAVLRGAPPQDGRDASASAEPFAGIVGESPAMKRTLAQAARLLGHRNARALILGETGTGKEVLARAIHDGGPRRTGPFVAVNCSAFPEHLIESELFGHERGAFTDAHAAKPGLFEVADGGTLFLDEIGDLPSTLQAKLLRVLEDREIRRVGGTRSRAVDVRILAATNECLPERVREGAFREDLFFRLSTVVLTLPPLRERGNDIFMVAEALLAQLAREHGLPVPDLSADACARLASHAWPGNVRELKHALERALLLSPAGELCPDELLVPSEDAGRRSGPIPFPAPLREITTAAAQATVVLCSGNRSQSARLLEISPKRLRRLLAGNGEAEADLAPGLDFEPEDDSAARPSAIAIWSKPVVQTRIG